MRFIGLDFGTTNSSLCYTHYNVGNGRWADPEPLQVGEGKVVRSLLLLDGTENAIAEVGEAAYLKPDFLRYPERVRQEFKMALGVEPEAPRWAELFLRHLLRQFSRVLNLDGSPTGDEFRTIVGAPARWVTHETHKVELLREAVAAAGFPEVEVCPEPIGAMYYHAFLGDIQFEHRAQRWLVVDFGGGTTDLALVETEPDGRHPVVLDTYGRPYGGKEFDQLLLEHHVLPRHWQGEPPDPLESLELLRAVRQFKESFSEKVALGQNGYSARWHGLRVRNPVELSRAQWESDGLGANLIARFTDILLDAFRTSGMSLSDIDRVILTGGSARWYFVREAANGLFGADAIVLSTNPELTISKGLALARTDFKVPIRHAPVVRPQAAPVLASSGDEIRAVDAIMRDVSVVDAKNLDLMSCRREAQAVVKQYVVGGGALALLLSPIPGVSSVPLTAGEAHLVTRIARIYGYDLKGEQVVAVVGGLLAGGAAIKVAVMETMTFFPGVGWALKGGIAAGAIKLLGEGCIKYFDDRRKKEQEGQGQAYG